LGGNGDKTGGAMTLSPSVRALFITGSKTRVDSIGKWPLSSIYLPDSLLESIHFFCAVLSAKPVDPVKELNKCFQHFA
jgi:hypothetical protein